MTGGWQQAAAVWGRGCGTPAGAPTESVPEGNHLGIVALTDQNSRPKTQLPLLHFLLDNRRPVLSGQLHGLPFKPANPLPSGALTPALSSPSSCGDSADTRFSPPLCVEELERMACWPPGLGPVLGPPSTQTTSSNRVRNSCRDLSGLASQPAPFYALYLRHVACWHLWGWGQGQVPAEPLPQRH